MLYMQEIRSIKLLYDKFIKKHWNISLKLIPDGLKKSVTIYLMVDDTLQSKFGTKFDCYSKLFDHTNKNGASYLNGHCFVWLAIAIPVLYNQEIHYIKIPIQYKLYDGIQTKLELATDMIASLAPALADYQVIVTWDSWYTKKPFLNKVKEFKNIDVIGGVRCDTAMYDINFDLYSCQKVAQENEVSK